MADTADLIRRFYDRVWNAWDTDAAHRILSPGLTFRGSLGDAVEGIEGFLGYRAKIRAAFPDFRNEIVDLVADGARAAARLRYTGTHEGEIFGVAPTGNRIDYGGAGFFEADSSLIVRVWVLGDMEALKRQLAGY